LPGVGRNALPNNTFKGWEVVYNGFAPITGRYKARRHGVTMCAGTRAGLESMITKRNQDERERLHLEAGHRP